MIFTNTYMRGVAMKSVKRKSKSKVFFTLLVLIFIMTAGSIGINAAESQQTLLSVIQSQSDVYNTIYSGLENSLSSINIEQYNLNSEAAFDVYFKLLKETPEFFYVAGTCNISTRNGIVVSIKPIYLMSGSQLSNAKQQYNTILSGIVNGVNAAWSDIEKVMYVNEYFTTNFRYDSSLSKYDTYTLFTEKTGVCQAYTLGFIAVMRELNIPVSYAESTDMNHIWNVVQVGGNWYHIDVTWNDPTADKPGRSSHTNFLLSDTGIQGTNHYNWESDYTCSSTKYDNYFWKKVDAPFVNANGYWYYVSKDDYNLYKYNFSNNTSTALFKINEKWPVIGSASTWVGCFSGLGVYNKNLYYSTPTKIYVYNTATGRSDVIHTPDTSNGYIYYFTINSNILTYYIYKSPNDSTMTDSGNVTLTAIEATYRITYKVDGNVYTTQTYREGDTVAAPQPPQKNDYDFVRWDTLPAKMPSNDVTVNAVFVKQECQHTSKSDRITKATCTTDGKKESVCNLCGYVLSTQVLPKTGHSYGEWITVKQATKTETGLKKKVCSVCGDEITEVIPKINENGPTATNNQSTPEPTNEPSVTQTDDKINTPDTSDSLKTPGTTDNEPSEGINNVTYICIMIGVAAVFILIIVIIVAKRK